MNPYLRVLAPAIVMACGTAAGAEAAAEVQAVNAQALAAMEAGKWEEALGLFDRCIAEHGEDALKRHGPSFGVTWYRKGICEMQLKRPEAAAKSFETCYRDFPNRGKGGENIFNKRALLRGAEAAQAAGRPAEAIRLFNKFLAERDKAKDPFDPGSYYIQVALCHLATGDVVQGAENLETAVRNRQSFKTPVSGMVAALQALVSAAIAEKDEATLAAFLEENRESLAIGPAEAAAYLPAFMRMATETMAAGMDRAAPVLFALPPSVEEMTAALKAEIAGTKEEAAKTELQARIDALEKAAADGTGHEAVRLEALAVILERQGKLREACAAYGELVSRFPRAVKREEHLFHLVQTGAAAGDPAAAAEHGPLFLETYPDSPRVPDVRRLMLLALFQAGNHEACIGIAAELLPKLPEGMPDHDACLHILGASFHQSGRHGEAAPLLERHAGLYPQSRFAQASQFFQAANRVRLEQWDEGAKLLDAFIAKYPQPGKNPYLSLTLLDRILCHLAKGEDAAALEKIGRLETEFPDAAATGPALGLKGDLLRKAGKAAEAETCYKQSLAMAERAGDRPAAAEALVRLAELLAATGGKARAQEAAAYCDRFWKDYGDLAVAREKIAVIQPTILDRAGRGEEALGRLREAIATSAENGAAASEAAIREYARIYAAKHGLEQLDSHFRAFPGLRPEDTRTRCLLKAAVAGVAEESLGHGEEAARAKADALLKTLYQELKSEFAPEDLPAGLLLRTGDFLRMKTSAPRQALPYYQELLHRAEDSLRFAALLGRAAVLAEGGKEEREGAVKDLETVLSGSPSPSEKEDALYWLVMIKMKAGDFAGAGNDAERYLAHDSGYRRYVPELRLALAASYQARDMVPEALAAHERVWREHEALAKVANPAMRAWMQLCWTRGKPAADGGRSDRQAAYEEGLAFLERTRPRYEKMPPFDQEIWLEIERLVTEYGNSTDVRRMAAGR